MIDLKKIKNWKELREYLLSDLKKVKGFKFCKAARFSESRINIERSDIGILFDIETQEIKFWGKASKSTSFDYTIKDLLVIENIFKNWSNKYLK